MAVFFSLLAAALVFSLYTLFLAELQVSGLAESFPTASRAEVAAFVDAWMFAGVVSMTATTTGLAALGVLVDDAASGRFREFLVTPVRVGELACGYLLAALIVALSLTGLVFVTSLVYLMLAHDVVMPADAVLRAAGATLVLAGAFTAVSALVTSLVSSPGAYAALSTIVGTLLGFLTGAYVPIGSLSEPVREAVTALPFAQATLLLRQEFASAPLLAIAGDSAGATAALQSHYGLSITVAGIDLEPWLIIGILICLATACLALCGAHLRRLWRPSGQSWLGRYIATGVRRSYR